MERPEGSCGSSAESEGKKSESRFSEALQGKKNILFRSQATRANGFVKIKSPSETEVGSAEEQPTNAISSTRIVSSRTNGSHHGARRDDDIVSIVVGTDFVNGWYWMHADRRLLHDQIRFSEKTSQPETRFVLLTI